MAKIGSLMDVGKRSLMNSQTGLQTVAHNISSKDVNGFSRQRVEFQTNVPVGEGNVRVGMGARAGLVTRTNNPFLEKQLQVEQSKLGYAETRNENLGRIESVFNEQMGKGLNKFVAEFFNAFRELANNPESQATRATVQETAAAVTRDFQRVNHQIRSIQGDIDRQIETRISEINDLGKSIAELNEAISSVEVQGLPANDERDRRDQILKDLGQKINIRYIEGDNGQIMVTVGQNALLVSGFEHNKLGVQTSDGSGKVRYGLNEITLQQGNDGPVSKITSQIKGGQMGGILDIRDQVAEDILNHVDNLAFTVASQVNDIHRLGFDGYGVQGGDFFELTDSAKDYSEQIQLSSSIADDPQRIVAGASAGATGDNRIANRISTLQFAKLMNDGTSTADDYFNGTIGQLAVKAKQAQTFHEHQKSMMDQMKSMRESISGVSLDEEATKMIEFQKTFNASAKVIKMADELFDTVLSLKR